MEREKPLPPGAGVVQKLLPILPGMPRCDELLLRLQGMLLQALPTVGVLVDATQPIVIQSVHLGGDVIASFSQGRKIGLLRQQLPEFSDEMLFRAFGAIEGLSAIQINELIMQGNMPAIVEIKQNDEGRMDPRVKIRTGEQPRPAQPESQPARAPAPPPAVRPAAGKEVLTPDDLSVLKRAPPLQGEQRQAG